jgi:hypothetical protein
MRITSGGDVLVGSVNNPNGRKLSVNGIISLQDGTTERSFWYWDGTKTQIVAVGAQDLTFFANSAERMRITSTGNVGIGTGSPVAKLDSRGTVYVATAFNGDNVLAFGGNPASGSVYTGAPSGANGSSFIVGESSNASGNPGFLKFYTTLSGVTSERMRIDSSGNVGIGTNSPSSFGKLAVTAASGVIGNFESTQSLTNANLLNLNATQTNSSAGIRFQVNSGTTAQARIQVNGDSAIVFQQTNSDTERMRIDSSGNLLVGTTSSVGSSKVISPTGFTSRLVSLTLNGTLTVTVPNGCICTMASSGFPGDSAIFSIKSSGGFQGCYVMAQGTASNIGFGTTSNPSTGTRLNVWISDVNTMSIQDVGVGARSIYLTFTSSS